MKRSTALSLVVAALLVTAACSEPGRIVFPSSPTTIPPAATGASSAATRITVGQNVRATLRLSDTPCEFGHGPEACVRFSIVPADSGVLWVTLTSAGPHELGLGIAAEVMGYDVRKIERTASVSGGSTYAILVVLSHADDGNASQAFELTTSLVH